MYDLPIQQEDAAIIADACRSRNVNHRGIMTSVGIMFEDIATNNCLSEGPADTSVDDGHANVTEDVMGVVAPQQLSNALPAVLCSVQLLEVVLASVRRHLQLWPCSIAMRPLLHTLPPLRCAEGAHCAAGSQAGKRRADKESLASSVARPCCLGLLYGLDDPLQIAPKVQRPLVQIAGRQCRKPSPSCGCTHPFYTFQDESESHPATNVVILSPMPEDF